MFKNLLWIDCIAGGLVGSLTLIFSIWLSQLYGLPRELLIVFGLANLLYGCYSFWLAMRQRRPMNLIILLVIANAVWAVICFILAVNYATTATVFGQIQLVGEGIFVGGLAWLEWKQRTMLLQVHG
ncbi:MAG: hypothetical protein JNJ77_05935 [Planctomycetia bacterium]|nr:hypothetical protein [Planctomycetia bacterium]